MLNGRRQIEQFELSDEYVYKIICEDALLYVSRHAGNISFAKFFFVTADNVDGFEAKHNNGKVEIYLHLRNKSKPHTMYVGETTDYRGAENWVRVVNQLYEKRKNNPSLTKDK